MNGNPEMPVCCNPSTEAEEDDVAFPIRSSIDDVQAIRLLKLQRKLVRRRLRGDMRDVAKWVQCGHLCPEVAANARAVGFIVRESHLQEIDQYRYGAGAREYGGIVGLDERDFLSSELSIESIRGTCCAMGDRQILTAGHVLDNQEREWLGAGRLWVIFGFCVEADGQTKTAFDSRTQMAKLVPPTGVDLSNPFQDDWLVLDIDRSMSEIGGRRPAAISQDALEDATPVYSFGHPNGLSLRYAFSPNSIPGPEGKCFRAFIDGYRCTSGSPIFDARSHDIVGIAVASGQNAGIVRIRNGLSLSQVCTPLTSRGVSCLRRP